MALVRTPKLGTRGPYAHQVLVLSLVPGSLHSTSAGVVVDARCEVYSFIKKRYKLLVAKTFSLKVYYPKKGNLQCWEGGMGKYYYLCQNQHTKNKIIIIYP